MSLLFYHASSGFYGMCLKTINRKEISLHKDVEVDVYIVIYIVDDVIKSNWIFICHGTDDVRWNN